MVMPDNTWRTIAPAECEASKASLTGRLTSSPAETNCQSRFTTVRTANTLKVVRIGSDVRCAGAVSVVWAIGGFPLVG